MNRFPLCIELSGRTVVLVGSGEQIRQKEEKLKPFGAQLLRLEDFTEKEAETLPAMVIVGDTPLEKAERISRLCVRRRIAVNVVDVPALCSFYFPALITRGDLTVGVSTGGKSPAAAAYLRQRIESVLPEETERILDWITDNRAGLKEKGILQAAIAGAFAGGRPLSEEEICRLEENKAP